jgi:DNA-binding beta-propeller fold protein YncE
VTSLQMSTAPGAIAYDPKSSTMIVGEYNVGNVSVYNAKTNALIRNTSTGSEVYTIAVDPGTGRIFVGNFGSDNVTVLGPKGQELGRSVTAGVGVFGSTYDPQDGDVYVASFDSDLVTIINSTTATGVGGYTSGTGPVAAAVDPVTGTVYVANYDSDSLSLLSPTFRVATYNVTFKESGLPKGTSWSIRFDGQGLSSQTRTILFSEPNGTGQPYAVAEVSGYTVSREFGTVHVQGHSLTVTITFTQTAPRVGPARVSPRPD